MEQKLIYGLEDLFETDEVVISQNKSSEFEESLLIALSPHYREYLINTYRDLISEAIKSGASNALIDDYIFQSAEAMTNSDEEIIEQLKGSIAMKRTEGEEDYLNELFKAATLSVR